MSSSQRPSGGDALGPRVRQLFTEEAPAQAPDTLRERVLRTTEATGQLKPWPRWLRPWGLRPTQVRRLSLLAGTLGLLIAAGVGLAVLAGPLLRVIGGQIQSPSPSPTAPAWHRVIDTPHGGYALADVAAGGSGFIAAGTGGLFGPGLSWVSSDGITWTEGPDAAALATISPDTVAVADSELVVLGRTCRIDNGFGSVCDINGIVGAHAPLSGTWSLDQAVRSSSAPGDAQGAATDIATGGPRLVAVGANCCSVSFPSGVSTVSGDASFLTARVWTSTDGLSWTSVPDGPVFDQSEITSVVYAKGQYVAVGAVDTAAGGRDARAWTSPDGLTWTRQPAIPASVGSEMLSVAAGGPGFVAVGTSGGGAAAWTSSDAVHWTRVPDGPALAGAQMHGVAAGSSGLVAVGYGSGNALVWHSSDGIHWSRAVVGPDFAGAQALSVAARGDTYVAVGQADPADDPQAYIWVGR
jgi:hypothetical protein